MGAHCVGCHTVNQKKPEYAKEPSDTSQFSPNKLSYKLQKLKFEGQIDNVEMLNYPYDIVSISYSINETCTCSLPTKIKNKNQKAHLNSNDFGISSKMKWKFEYRFPFQMDEYEIRKSFIKISIYKQQVIPILQLKLNLYQIITGPYHHDLALNFQRHASSRLLFDLKISQRFYILINPLEVSVHLNQQYPGEQFNYSFNSYSSGQKICSADGSVAKKVAIFTNIQGNYRELRPQDECQSPTKIRKGINSNKVIKNTMTSQLKWAKNEEIREGPPFKKTQCIQEEQLAMPTLNLTLNSNQISKSSLQFTLWNIHFSKTIAKNMAILFSDCYISFPRLFQTDCLNIESVQNNSQYSENDCAKATKKSQSRVCILEQLLIKDGKPVGKLKIKLKIINQAYFSQLSLYATTQDGVVQMNSLFKNYIGKQKTLKQSQSILKIQHCFQKIVQLLYSLSNVSKQRKRSRSQIALTQERTLQEFTLLISFITASLEESFVLRRKHDISEIIEKQNVLLGILERVVIVMQQQNAKFMNEKWKVFFLISKRGEFYLQNIGFSECDKAGLSTEKQSGSKSTQEFNTAAIFSRKIKTALRYQEIIYKALIISFGITIQNQSQSFIQVQAFKVYGYFRVPRFREQVLKCIVRSEENQEFDQQSIQMLHEQPKVANTMLKFEQNSSSHLDWEKHFYSHLENQKKYYELNSMLVESFQNTRWFQDLVQRRKSFYIFIQYFAKKTAQFGRRLKLIKYSYCPGYNKVVKSILIQLKKQPITQYTSFMIQTSTSLLANHNLINIIIPIVVEKTNLYDSISVNQFLNILSTFFKYLTQNGTKTIPQKFDHTYFFRIIKLVLDSEYSYAIAKLLVILHTYFECFNSQFKDILSLYLLGRVFFRLFFHWSFNIRIIFYHLFIIKIYWSKLNGVTEKANHMDIYHNENCQIYNRYKKLIKILNTAERQRHIAKKNMKRTERQEYYIKMKKKLSKRIKHNPKKQSEKQRNNGKKDKQNISGLDGSSDFENYKQRTSNLERLNTLCQLKDGYNKSQTLCSSQIKEHLKFIQSNKSDNLSSLSQVSKPQRKFSQNDQLQKVENFSINLRTNKRYISQVLRKTDTDISVKQQIQKLNDDYIRKLSLNDHKVSSSQDKPLLYTFFGNEDYQLEEISLNQQNKILMGMGEFRETQEFVEKYILQKGVAPHVNLDPEIQLDTNQFKPQDMPIL